MKKVLLSVVVLVLVAAGAFWFLGGVMPQPVDSAPAAEATDVPLVTESGAVIAEARVVPAREASLSVPINGLVSEVLVAEGERVEAGQVLLRLDSTRQNADMARAIAELKQAQARLEEMQAGARPQEIAAAEALLDSAQAQLNRAEQGALAAEIAAAEANLAAAEARLQRLLDGTDPEQLIAAEAELANAEAELNQAQSAYDQVKWRSDIAQLPESVRLQQATNQYNAAKARLENLRQGASAAEIASARAEVQAAQAELDRLRSRDPAEIAAAEANVRRYQAELELLKAGALPQAIKVAEADVAIAESNLRQAVAALSDTTVRAPFAGVVAAVLVEAGEQATAGTPVIRLAEQSSWQVETADLTEFDVVDIQVGQEVTLTFDAIPDLELPGTVTHIRAIGEDRQGDVIYTAVIQPQQTDERLRWNMTSIVHFQE